MTPLGPAIAPALPEDAGRRTLTPRTGIGPTPGALDDAAAAGTAPPAGQQNNNFMFGARYIVCVMRSGQHPPTARCAIRTGVHRPRYREVGERPSPTRDTVPCLPAIGVPLVQVRSRTERTRCQRMTGGGGVPGMTQQTAPAHHAGASRAGGGARPTSMLPQSPRSEFRADGRPRATSCVQFPPCWAIIIGGGAPVTPHGGASLRRP